MFWPLPSGDRSKVLKLDQSLAENCGKVNHAKKTLQLLDILRWWAIFNFCSVVGRGGCSRRRNHVSKDFKRGCYEEAFFQVDGEAIGS
jgi:hypothetical protein